MKSLSEKDGWYYSTNDNLIVVWSNKFTGETLKQRKRLPDSTCKDRKTIQKIYFNKSKIEAIKWIMTKFNWRLKQAYDFFNELRGI